VEYGCGVNIRFIRLSIVMSLGHRESVLWHQAIGSEVAYESMKVPMPNLRIAPASDVLVPGQVTRVPIVLNLEEPVKVRGLHATLHGAEESQATYSSYNPATKSTQVHTAIEHVDIVKREFLLSGNERKGFVGNLADGFATLLGGGDHDILEPGEYAFEVEVLLPSDARPSFAGKKCRVFYALSAQLDIPLARDVKAQHAFEVVEGRDVVQASPTPVRTRYPEDQETGLMDAWFAPDVRVELALPCQAYQEGDTLQGTFTVEAPEPLVYDAINARLISVETTTAHGHADSFSHSGNSNVVTSSGVIDNSYTQRFSLPVSLPGPKQGVGDRFQIECFLQIELDVPWAKDPKIRVPITVL